MSGKESLPGQSIGQKVKIMDIIYGQQNEIKRLMLW